MGVNPRTTIPYPLMPLRHPISSWSGCSKAVWWVLATSCALVAGGCSHQTSTADRGAVRVEDSID
jgi:hypothetical protein